MTKTMLLLAALLSAACASAPPPAAPEAPPTPEAAAPKILSQTRAQSGGTAISEEMIGRSFPALSLKKAATAPGYGTTQQSPIHIGGGFGNGSHRTYGYLNALRGPHGEAVHYDRIGTCCPFPSKASPFGEGILEVYEVTYEGGAPQRLYFDWYSSEEPLIVAGLTAAP
jgi:hypothetical protein